MQQSFAQAGRDNSHLRTGSRLRLPHARYARRKPGNASECETPAGLCLVPPRAQFSESRRRCVPPAPCRRWRRPSRAISSSLCNVARETVTPPTVTGFKCATGVRAPVRPTCTSMFSNTVAACLAGYLKAMAQRGAFAVQPSRSCCGMESTFATTPSVSYGSPSRLPSHSRINASKFVEVFAAAPVRIHLETGGCQAFKILPVARAKTVCHSPTESRRSNLAAATR